MANTLRFKRGLASGLPTGLAGEPLFTTDTFDLYIGNGTGNTRFQKYIASGTTGQLLRGDGSLLTMPIVLTSPSNGQVLKFNGTNWVNDSDAGITGSGSAGQVAYFTGATTQSGSNNLFWNNTSVRLGIGTNNPQAMLDVAQGIRVNSGGIVTSSFANGLNMGTWDAIGYNAAGNTVVIGGYRTSQWSAIGFYTSGNEVARINGGNFIINNASTDNGLRFQVTGDGYFSGDLRVGTTSTTGYWPANLTTASAKTGIYYTDAATNLDNANAGLVILNTSATGGTSSKLVFGANNGDGSPVAVGLAYISAFNATRTSGYLAGNLVFGTSAGGSTGAVERMRLDASGNLGLGVVPSAWTSTRAIQVGLSGSIANRSGGNGFYMSSNLYFSADPSNTAANGVYINSDFATTYLQANGAHRWFNAPSGTAGANITFTQAMTLFATGNLAVGTTTDAGYKLDVNGTMRVSGALTVASTGYTQAVFNGTNTSDWGNHIGFQAQGTVFGYVGSVGSLLGNTTKDMTIWSTAGNGFRVYTNGNNLRLQIDSAGAATFSSSVSATIGGFSNYITIGGTSGLNIYGTINVPTGERMFLNSYHGLELRTSGGVGSGTPITVFSVSSAGAATFSSSVTAASFNGTTNNIFSTGGTERMRLDASGNLGLGVTPSAWGTSAFGTNTRAFELSQLGSFIGAGAGALIIGNNYYGTNTQAIYARSSLPATQYQMNTSAGTHSWHIAPSGTAGNAITFTQAMTLDASGRLGIGITSPVRALNIVSNSPQIRISDSVAPTTNWWELYSTFNTTNQDLFIQNQNGIAIRLNATGDMVLGTSAHAGYKLDVNGTMRVSGASTFGSSISAAGQITGPSGVSEGKFNFLGYNGAYGGITSNTGYSNFYNAVYLYSNFNLARNGQGNTAVPSYILELGGSTPNDDSFAILRSPAGSFTFSNLFKVSGTGAATFSSSVTAGGDITTSKSSLAIISATDTSNTTTTQSYLRAVAGTTQSEIGSYGQTKTAYKIVGSGDMYLYKSPTAGDIAILNDQSTGSIKMAAGGSSTAHLTIASTGAATFSSTAQAAGFITSGGTGYAVINSAATTVTALRPTGGGSSIMSTNSNGLHIAVGTQAAGDLILASNNTERIRLSQNGFFSQLNATNPSASITDSYIQYSADVTAGNAAPHFRTENGAVIKIYQETTAVGNAIVGAGGGSAMLDDDTFDGYTLRQVVRALRNQGILQ